MKGAKWFWHITILHLLVLLLFSISFSPLTRNAYFRIFIENGSRIQESPNQLQGIRMRFLLVSLIVFFLI